MARRGGWRRLGRRRFRYVNAAGAAIRDEEHLERIRALVIPPAWQDVWISPNPSARIQATGVDAAGRTQYRYHASFRAAQERAKFERLLDFAKVLPALRTTTARHLRGEPYEHEWTCALAVGLVNKAWFRVGSDRHARRSRTYGVTTLTKRHASVEGDEVQFRFRTKNRTLVRRTIRSAPLARGVADLLDLAGGSRLFRYERDGELYPLTGAQLNEYLGGAHGGRVHGEGLPDLGRDAARRDRARTPWPGGGRARSQAHARGGHARRREGAREHPGSRALVVRELRRSSTPSWPAARSRTSGARTVVRRGATSRRTSVRS